MRQETAGVFLGKQDPTRSRVRSRFMPRGIRMDATEQPDRACVRSAPLSSFKQPATVWGRSAEGNSAGPSYSPGQINAKFSVSSTTLSPVVCVGRTTSDKQDRPRRPLGGLLILLGSVGMAVIDGARIVRRITSISISQLRYCHSSLWHATAPEMGLCRFWRSPCLC